MNCDGGHVAGVLMHPAGGGVLRARQHEGGLRKTNIHYYEFSKNVINQLTK